MHAGIFVNKKNILYATDRQNGVVHVWLEGLSRPIRTIASNLDSPTGIFVTSDDDIYVNNGGRVDKWSLNSTNAISSLSVSGPCAGLFVDLANNIYCSNQRQHLVITINDVENRETTVAGTGSPGSASNALNTPYGIFVDTNSDLYVADAFNHRIQLFKSGELDGVTVVGEKSAETTITLNHPTSVMLDADGYLFIVDSFNHRIIGSNQAGFWCVAGCTGAGSASNQLDNPTSATFDGDGNIYVIDTNNKRIQLFMIRGNVCGELN